MSKKDEMLEALAPKKSAEPAGEAPPATVAPELAGELDAASPTAAADAPPAKLETIEHWAKALKTPAWLFAGAKLGNGWAIGQEMTEEKYCAAIDAAKNVVSR